MHKYINSKNNIWYEFGQNKVGGSDARGHHRHADIFRNFSRFWEPQHGYFQLTLKTYFNVRSKY